jgi:quinol monooxygenase YgiN
MQLIATFRVKDGSEGLVRDLLLDYARRVLDTPGTVLFEPSTVAGTPQEFVVFERYDDEPAFRRHLEATENTEFNVLLEGHLVGEVALQFLEPLRVGRTEPG